MPIKRRGSRSYLDTWTTLFHRIGTEVVVDVQEPVNREISEITLSTEQYMQKNTNNDDESSINPTVAIQTKSDKDMKADNVIYNKTDNAVPNAITNDNYEYETESECSISCISDAGNFNQTETDTENFESSFVHLEHEDDISSTHLRPIKATIKGLPNHVTEDQILKELAKNCFFPIAVEKITFKDLCQSTDPLFLMKVPEFVASRLSMIDTFLGYEVDVQTSEVEVQELVSKCSKYRQFEHDKTSCDVLNDESTKRISETKFVGSNSITDLGYTSNNSQTSCASISKVDIFSSSRNSTPNSPSKKIEHDKSTNSIPKETYLRDTAKLMEELKEIKKEVENIKFELKINVAKKVDSDFICVILQGIPAEIKNEDIVNELKSKHFSVDTIYRLKDTENEITDEVVFELPKEEDHIFYFSCCLGFEVRVEEYKDDFSLVKNGSVLCSTFDENISLKKPINVLFRGIPMDVSESDILRDLQEKCFHPIAAHGMVPTKRYLQGKTKYVVLVQVPPEEEYIYELSCVLGYPVTVESIDKGSLQVAQCKTCLQFGHSTVMCSGNISEASNSTDKKIKIRDGPTINVVLKGVPIEFNDDLVLNDLFKNGFSPIAIHRMVINEEILPTYLVQVPEQEKRIYMLTCCLGFSIKVEKYIPHLYRVEQCDKCREFGHCGDNCPNQKQMESPNEISTSEFVKKNTDSETSFDKNLIDINNCDKMETQKESSISLINYQNIESNSTQTGCLQQELTDIVNKLISTSKLLGITDLIKNKLEALETQKESDSNFNLILMQYLEQELATKFDTLEASLKTFIAQKNKEILKQCCYTDVSTSSKNDLSTNTDNTYAQIEEMNGAIESYQNISSHFLKNMDLFAGAFMDFGDGTDISGAIKVILRVKEMSESTTSIVEVMIRVLKSATSLMMNIPNLPGVTFNTLNEQLHLLEELETLKMSMDSTPDRFSRAYDVNFPEL